MKETILTGLRSNDELTLANYLGGILPIINLQKRFAKQYTINMFVPDLHSFTTPIEHTSLYDNTIKNLKYYAAAGLDLDDPNTFLYRQSYIPAHSELTWILDCFTGFGEMKRMIQFKDKSLQLGQDRVSVGLFNYPVLMAADILLYNAKWVPVGEDQFQHLEITRDIAARLNKKFGNLFVVPADTKAQVKFLNHNKGLRIKSLTDPTKKMSKSSDNPKSKILLTDSPEAAQKKIMSATTDDIGVINYDLDNQPGISNLLQILALLTDTDLETVINNWQGQTSYRDLKQATADACGQFLSNFKMKLDQIDEAILIKKLTQSEQAMNEIAKQTLLRVQTAVGLRA